MMRLPQMSQPPRLKNRDRAQREFNNSLRDLLALLDEERLLDVEGVIWRFRTTIGNRKGFGDKFAYVVKALFRFSGSQTGHGIRSSGNTRYFPGHLLFYCRRLLFTLTHLPKELLLNKKHSPAVERAAAKNRITRQLLRMARQRQV